jgi:hypothetical protein
MTITTLAFLGGLLAAGMIVALIMAMSRFKNLENELERYKASQQKRMRYDTLEGVEDAIAVVLTAVRHEEEIKLEIGALEARLARAADILRQVRGGEYGSSNKHASGNK